jgi:hypothetical protein
MPIISILLKENRSTKRSLTHHAQFRLEELDRRFKRLGQRSTPLLIAQRRVIERISTFTLSFWR